MIPILFPADEPFKGTDAFMSNGLGRLSDAIKCEVTEVLKGSYELELEYPIDGIHYNSLLTGCYIYALPCDGAITPQPFEIYRIGIPLNGIVTVYAWHLSYRLSYVPVAPFISYGPQDAITQMNSHVVESNPFTVTTNISGLGKNAFNVYNCVGSSSCRLNTDGTLSISNSSTDSSSRTETTLKKFCPNLRVGDTVTLSFTRTNTSGATTGNYIYLDTTEATWTNRTTRTLTQDDLDSKVRFYCNQGSSPIETATISNIQIEFGNTVTSYEPYNSVAGLEINSKVPHTYRELIGGIDGNFIDLFGAEPEFDMFNIRLNSHRGYDNGVRILYGKNLTSMNYERSDEEYVTHYYPYWSDGEDICIVGDIIPSPWIDETLLILNENLKRVVPFDTSSYLDAIEDPETEVTFYPTVEEINAVAELYMLENGIGLPGESMTVSFIGLWETEEYKEIAPVERVRLGDTVNVFNSKVNLDFNTRVIKTVYDTLAERYISIELGQHKNNLETTILNFQNGDNSEEITKAIVQSSDQLKRYIDDRYAAAEDYADQRAAESKEYTDTEVDGAKDYTDGKTAESKEYTDTQVDGAKDYTDGKTRESKSYTDTQVGTSISYTDSRFNTADQAITTLSNNTAASISSINGEITTIKTTTIPNLDAALQRKMADDIATATSNWTAQMNTALANQMNLMNGGTGGYVVTITDSNDKPQELIIGDHPTLATMVNLIRINQNGIAFSHNGYEGPYVSAWTIDGQFSADFITTGTLSANVLNANNINSALINTGGLNAGTIKTGSFAVVDDDENIIFSINLDDHAVTMNASYVLVSTNKTIVEEVSGISENAQDAKDKADSLDTAIREGMAVYDSDGNIVGVKKVITTMGYFDDDGLVIAQDKAPTLSRYTVDGMEILRNDDSQTNLLTVNHSGVYSENVSVRTYLDVGQRYRFQNIGSDRMGCFYIGG